MQRVELARRSFGLVLLGGLAACSKPSVQTTQAYAGGRMARPDRVLVEAFAVTPDEVKLDQGVAARMQRASSDVPLSVQQMQVAREAQSNLADTMVKKLLDYGLPSARVWGTQLPPTGRYLLVQGQIVAVDQGNRTRRTLVGFGAGKSEIAADMQLYSAEGERRPVFLAAYDGTDGSGRGPGMAETMGVGGAAGNLLASTAIGSALHLGSESRRANSQSEAQRLGEILAKQVALFAVAQGWLPPNAVS